MLRSVYRAARSIAQKSLAAPIIRAIDRDVPVHVWHGSAFYPGAARSVDLPRPVDFDETGTHLSRRITAQMGEVAADVVGWLAPFIREYLGDHARLDDLVLFWFDPSRTRAFNISGSWHDDNVGHRLKTYICLQGDGSTPTVVLPDSHRRPYAVRLAEIGRAMGREDHAPKDGEERLAYRTGDVAIFDTHCLHRGLYEEPAGERVVLVAEFVNRYKADAISGKAPCGPGGCPTGKVLFSPEAYIALGGTGLIDERLTRPVDGGIEYSLSNL